METITNFKPMLIPNFKKETDWSEKAVTIAKGVIGALRDYYILPKKDGCRCEIIDGELHSRSFVDKKDSSQGLKLVKSTHYREQYKELAEECQRLGIVLEGELFSTEMVFNEICRRFKTEDITAQKHKTKLAKVDLDKEFYGRSIEWLTSHQSDLKLYLFDLYFIANKHMTAVERLSLMKQLFEADGPLHKFSDIVVLPKYEEHKVEDFKELHQLYEDALTNGYEGLVLMHKNSHYKQGRATLLEGIIYKLKEDCIEYDAQIIGVEESMVSIGETTTLKAGKQLSGMAKGFIVSYEGEEFTVQLKDCPHTKRKAIWDNRQDYVGQWITYTGMKPVKKVPRHAFLLRFRDDK